MNPGPCPPEPPVGAWVKDRFGGVTQRRIYAGQNGWGPPGCLPVAQWEPMWEARGPLEVCGEWGRPLVFEPTSVRPLEVGEQRCPHCRQLAVWRSEASPPGWYHDEVDSRWCDMDHDDRGPAADGGPRLAKGWSDRSRVGAVSKHNAELWR